MMPYLIPSNDQIFVKGYGYLAFAKYIVKNISKNLSNKYSVNIFDHGKE